LLLVVIKFIQGQFVVLEIGQSTLIVENLLDVQQVFDQSRVLESCRSVFFQLFQEVNHPNHPTYPASGRPQLSPGSY
jgi:hypothetical protein